MANTSTKHPLGLRIFGAGLAGVTALAILGSLLPAHKNLDVENFEVSTFLPYESCGTSTGFRVLGTECQQQVASVDNVSIQFLSTRDDTRTSEYAAR